MKKVAFFIILILVSINSYAIFRTPETGRLYYWLFSPELLGRSMGVVGTENPSGVVINPATQAFAQRIKIETSFGFAPGLLSTYYNNDEYFDDAGDFFFPFIVNGGAIIPSRYGNFSIYANFMNMSNLGFEFSNNNDLGIGKIGSLYFGYSKDYSNIVAFGINGNFKIVYNPMYNPELGEIENKFDVAGGIDLGFIFRPEISYLFSDSYWGFQDFEVAVTLKDLGKPITNFPQPDSTNFHWFPNPFTAATGISFNVFNDGKTHWKFLSDLAFPFFQNVTASLGTEVQIVDLIVLRSSYTFDLEGVLEFAGVIPKYGYLYYLYNTSFGISFKFSTDFFKRQTKAEIIKNKHKTTSFSIDLGFRPYYQGFIFEAGCTVTLGVRDNNPPTISYVQEDSYISPNFDGVQDEAVVDLDIKDERYIVYWKMEIYDENKKVVKTIEGKEPRVESLKPKEVVKKFFAPKSSILIPKQVIWDGRDNNGNVVPDGKYTFKFFAMDDNKNIDNEGSREGEIIIDTEKPEVKSELTNKVFSPNDDGSKDELIIDIDIIKDEAKSIYEEIRPLQKKEMNLESIPQLIESNAEVKSEKQQWFVEIINSNDEVVKKYVFDEKGNKKISWDGKDENGNKVPDGVYKVKIHSTDLAGNYWEDILRNIIIDTRPTPLETTLTNNIFSPNGDGVNDNIGFKFNIPIINGIVRWKFDILDKNNKEVRRFQGEGIPALELKWNGYSDKDKVVSDGIYKGKLSVVYENGNMPNALTPDFIVDLTPPNGRVSIQKTIFSPNGDGKYDQVKIDTDTTEEEEWRGYIYDSIGKVVKSYIWKSKPPKTFNWDGKGNDNKLLQDGKYYFEIASTDLAGNSFESNKIDLRIFTEEIPVFITSTLESFSPNGDNIKDLQNFDIRSKLSINNRVSEWKLIIYDEKDKAVLTKLGGADIPNSSDWDGENDNGGLVSDGYYYAVLNVEFESGTSSKSKTNVFTVDTLKPEIEIMAENSIFSPNNDGFLDNIKIFQKGSDEDQWEAYFTGSDNKIIWKKSYKGRPEKIEIWNGKDISGNISKNGLYKYSIKSTDKAGNSNFAEIDNIELKNLYTPLFITLENEKFSPNDDDTLDYMKFMPIVDVKEGLELYKLEILNEKKETVMTYQGKNEIPEIIEWNGLSINGDKLPDGIYSSKLSLLYNFGNRPIAESSKFVLDTTPPKIKLTKKPEYFSPDNDGNDDELSIFIDSYDLTGIKEWKISIMTPDNKKEFVSFSGLDKPTNRIIWDGKDSKGELVDSAEDYPVRIYAEDIVGNKIDVEADTIMVDILVIKLDDGRLKIKISNIQFKPDSAEMTDTPKNKKILDLLAHALKKYGQYSITVEGHANKFAEGLNEVVAKKLSEERAKTVAAELNKRGIFLNRMSVVGKGFDNPIVPLTLDASQEEMAKNRRVEFYLDKGK